MDIRGHMFVVSLLESTDLSSNSDLASGGNSRFFRPSHNFLFCMLVTVYSLISNLRNELGVKQYGRTNLDKHISAYGCG